MEKKIDKDKKEEKKEKIGPSFFRKKAKECVETFDTAKPDYTTDSLKRLDTLIDKNWSKKRFEKAEFGKTDNFDNMAFTGLVLMIGSYFGEVLVKELGGVWKKSEEFGGWVVNVKGVQANIFHVVQDCFEETSKLHLIHKIVAERSHKKIRKSSNKRGS